MTAPGHLGKSGTFLDCHLTHKPAVICTKCLISATEESGPAEHNWVMDEEFEDMIERAFLQGQIDGDTMVLASALVKNAAVVRDDLSEYYDDIICRADS